MSDGQRTLRERYRRAEKLQQGVFTKQVAFNTTLFPHWVGESDCFWYVRDLNGGGSEYRWVDACAGTNEAATQAQIHEVIQPAEASRPDIHQKVSPDGGRALFNRDHNLWLKDLSSGEEKPLTTDGEAHYVYAGTPTTYGRKEQPETVEALWSADGKRVFTLVTDTRRVGVGMPLVQHVPAEGVRPRIINPDRRVAAPGDEHIEVCRFLVIDVASGEVQWADCEPTPVFYPNFIGYFTGYSGWWDRDNRHAYFVHRPRGGKTIQLIQWDTQSGQSRIIIDEHTDTNARLIPISHIQCLLQYLPDTDELIWYSERSGSAHLYLYDLKAGALKHPITQGPWLVRNLLHVDNDRRELWIQTADRIDGKNPYYSDICRINMDTGELAEVLSTDHEYVVCDQRSVISSRDMGAKGVSPDGLYLVATRTRVDQVPVSILLDRDGEALMTLETADVSGLPDNWRWPEPHVFKADDGETAICGVVFKPSDFDPEKSYPVIDASYGYSGLIGAFDTNRSGDWIYLSAAAYAELGFIVVNVEGRGNYSLRNKAFNDYDDPRLPSDPVMTNRRVKGDAVHFIRQLAQRDSSLDLNRVGVVDFCSRPMALAGMLGYPDFYKVGVSLNPLADTRLFACFGYGKERVWPEFEELAGNLQGKLLLIHGMLDDVMPVSMTFRIAEALQKRGKRFDMMILPNLGHGSSSYSTQCSWDYVVEHLLGEQPPQDFQLKTSWD